MGGWPCNLDRGSREAWKVGRAGIAVLAALALFVMAPLAGRTEERVTFATSELVIETADGASHRFVVELAVSMRQRARGLMYRDDLAPDAGMLFVYPGEQQIRMWMRNTLIPLDMLFIGSDGRIIDLAEDTVPLSEDIIASSGPARAVIELGSGTARRLGIRPGDRVRHPLFGDG